MAARKRGEVAFGLNKLEAGALVVAVRRGQQLAQAGFRLEMDDETAPRPAVMREALEALEGAPVAMDTVEINVPRDIGVQMLLAAEIGLRAIEAMQLVQNIGTMERGLIKLRAAAG